MRIEANCDLPRLVATEGVNGALAVVDLGPGSVVGVSCELDQSLIAGELPCESNGFVGTTAFIGLWPMALRQMTDLILARFHDKVEEAIEAKAVEN